VLLITACALGDRLRRRRLFAGGLGLFVLASAACALAPNAGLLTAARSGMAYEAMIAPLVLAGAGISMAIRPAGMRWSARCRQPSSARPQPRRPIHRGAPPTLG